MLHSIACSRLPEAGEPAMNLPWPTYHGDNERAARMLISAGASTVRSAPCPQLRATCASRPSAQEPRKQARRIPQVLPPLAQAPLSRRDPAAVTRSPAHRSLERNWLLTK